MSHWFDMGNYGLYVWPSYALFLGILAWDFLVPRLRERAALRQAALKLKRQSARQTP